MRIGRFLIALLLVVTAPSAAQPTDEEVTALRTRIESASTELRSIAAEVAEVRAEARSVQEQLQAYDRDENLGPVQRRRYSTLKQQSTQLTEKLNFLQALEGRVRDGQRDAVRELIRALEPRIADLKEGYQKEPIDSASRVRLFREYERLVAERNDLNATLFPPIPYLVLDVRIGASDSPRALREKADLLADNRDIIARLLGRLSTWKRELIEDREIRSEARRLEEENSFFMRVDPLETSVLPAADGAVELPNVLREFAARLAIPPQAEWRPESFDLLIERIEVLERELEDTILSMDERRKLMLDEAGRREGVN